MTNFPVTAGDTGLTISDSTVKKCVRAFSSTGLTNSDSVAAHIHAIHYDVPETGLSLFDSIYEYVIYPPLPVNTTVKYKWTMKLFNYNGSEPVEVDYSGYSYDTTTNEIFHATNRTMNFYLNGVDDCSFTLYLDDPMAAEIIPLKTVVKVWRTVYEGDGETVIFDDATGPGWASFAGLVTSTLKDGDANTMQVQCYSPLWKLQTRFHVHNHYLVNDPETGDQFTGTGIIFRVIELLNDTFLAHPMVTYTGIEIGTRYWYGEPQVAPYFIAAGTNSWSIIFDDILNRPAAPDMIPNYNDDGTNIMCILDTSEKRGNDNSGTVFFKYRTGTNDNCDNITEEYAANPGDFANWVWAVGQGGANSGKVALAWDNDSGEFDSTTVGLYMKNVDEGQVKRLKALQSIADSELDQSRVPKRAMTITLNPYGGLIYNHNFGVGDVVRLIADKNALQVNLKQRIYQIGLTISDNNVEIATPLVSKDFYGKVAT